jgi:hypothetical protein
MLPVANKKVVFKALADGAVLFCAESEIYFTLNVVGARVWELLPPKCATFDELCAAIAAEYPAVDPEMIRADVLALLSDLESNRLILPEPNDQTDERTASETGNAESARSG